MVMMMAEKKEDRSVREPEMADGAAKQGTKKTASASEIDTVQMKKKLPVRKAQAKPAGPVRTRKAKTAPAKNIGIPVTPPEKGCDDKFCPYHGKLSVRGIILDVQIVAKKMQGTVVVKRERRHYVKKYQRYEKRSSRYLAHLPPCMNVEVGDMVKVMECRPLSKNTSMVVVGRI
jgi:small subunit ribosomal protein S17